ncbi:MAG TPA: Gfo/Idh/MocA family oxidoreductase, partial [Streptosporangiaceae bacterium]|nr:Gfo/Idh/MocA family oxidoreductase [Streptosporangiaceae bacterium]
MVGLGSRSDMFTSALLGTYPEQCELTGLCDVNATRMDYYNRQFADRFGAKPVPCYGPADFRRMLDEQRVDVLIVTSVDRTHHRYIIGGLDHGCEVITEKPLTVDAAKCQAILDATRRTGKRVRVAFNYRYSPRNSVVKRLLAEGAIGSVLSVHFEWLLDTRHGADYFRRWHRDKRNSGGLMVHKASHHWDLVNWWLGSRPETVYGVGRLAFYGRENAEERGVTRFYERAHGSEVARDDPFALDLTDNPKLRGLYLEGEAEDGYLRDQSVFGNNISIEDDMAVLVSYASGATMTYHLTAYSPWEGYRVMFNGTRGRLELDVTETSYVSGARDDVNQPGRPGRPLPAAGTSTRLLLRPLWEPPREVEISEEGTGHGGGDVRMLAQLLGGDRE